MKIAIIQPRISYYVGGGEKVPMIHSELLANLGHRVSVYTTKVADDNQSFLYEGYKNKNDRNITIKEFEIPAKFEMYLNKEAGEDRNRWDTECLLFNQLVYKDLLENKPDILISYYVLDGLFKPLNIKSVLYFLGYSDEDLDMRVSFLRFFDVTISISNNVHKRWGKYLNPKAKSFVLNSGVGIDDKNTKVESEFLQNIVFAGRLIERKGVRTLIEAFSNVVAKNSDVQLWIIGYGPQKGEYIKLVKKMKLGKSVKFINQVSNLSDYFRMSDICVFPSYEKEGLMSVVLEAMSVGKVVVTTSSNGNEDVIENNKNGILVTPKDSVMLEKELSKLLGDKKRALDMGKKARRYVEDNLTWKEFQSKFDTILSEIVN